MSAVTTIIAGASLALSAGGAYMSYQQQRQASKAQDRAAEEQRGIQGEQKAANAEAAAAERRQQVREARIRRAQILQSAENTGTAASSGEVGALSSLSTQLNTNLGTNASSLNRAGRISNMSQRAADAGSQANQHMMNAGVYQGLSNLGGSIFQASGGWGTLGSAMKSSNPTSPFQVRAGLGMNNSLFTGKF